MEFHCNFCERPRAEVTSLVPGPRIYICDACVLRCMDLAAGSGKESDGIRLVMGGPSSPEPRATCRFCKKAYREVRLAFEHEESGIGTNSICADCIGLSIHMLADASGGVWKKRIRLSRELSGE
jgi:hypothetical protein